MSYIGLVDCNSFYASCEKLFRPDLAHKPVVVLSNNDGCIVSLSKEAKDIGIQRGLPLFEIQNIIKSRDVAVFSSNYTLYQDISDRVMNLVSSISDKIEIYSIDECFFIKQQCDDYQAFASKVSKTVRRCVGIPVSVGIARTKTLAKIANHIAKKGSLSYVIEPEDEQRILKETGIDNIWGIGWRSLDKCRFLGLKNAWDFACLSDDLLLKYFTVTGYNTAYELRGKQMIFDKSHKRLSVTSSISFRESVRDYDELERALACHCTSVCKKLVNDKLYAKQIAVMLKIGTVKEHYSYISDYGELDNPSNYVPDLLKLAKKILKRIFIGTIKYRALGIVCYELYSKDNLQFSLFDLNEQADKLKTKESISNILEENNIFCGSTDMLTKKEMSKADKLSPCYTTKWNQLPLVGLSDTKYTCNS